MRRGIVHLIAYRVWAENIHITIHVVLVEVSYSQQNQNVHNLRTCEHVCTVCMRVCNNVEVPAHVSVPEVAFLTSRLVASRFAARGHVFVHWHKYNKL